MKKLIVISILFLLFAACTPQPVEAEPQVIEVEVTRIVRETVIVTQIVERVITATPLPSPTPTPTFDRWTLEQAAEAIQAAGLEFESPRPMTGDDYGLAPVTAGEGIRFLIPSLCPECGGRLMWFDDPQALEMIKIYYETLGENPLYFSWVFQRDNILLQINGDLPEDQAMLYKTALEDLQ